MVSNVKYFRKYVLYATSSFLMHKMTGGEEWHE